jgi:hypothetical protein
VTGRIAKVKEYNTTVITPSGDPTRQMHLGTNIAGAEFASVIVPVLRHRFLAIGAPRTHLEINQEGIGAAFARDRSRRTVTRKNHRFVRKRQHPMLHRLHQLTVVATR